MDLPTYVVVVFGCSHEVIDLVVSVNWQSHRKLKMKMLSLRLTMEWLIGRTHDNSMAYSEVRHSPKIVPSSSPTATTRPRLLFPDG